MNIPIRTVLLTKLCKFDGEKTAILSVRDFHQIAGRAGRKGFDDRGSVVAQAPEHVIENLRLEAKAAGDPAKRRKLVKKKPPDKGYVHWDRATFERLVSSPPEPLVSRFTVSHGMILEVLSRPRGGCRAMARLVKSCHERPAQKRVIGRTALAMYGSLLEAGVVRIGEYGRPVVDAGLQEDFSLNHALSLYLLHAIDLLDRESETYALDLLTLVESILENPDVVLFRQLDKLKGAKLAELKAAGVEYDERMEELERLEYPKPNRDFVYDTFNAFAKARPWVATENIRPKSIAREMFENFQSFSEYVKEYGLERAEGVLLRYLSDAYKTLVQSVPAKAKTPEVDDVVTYFGAMVRAVDSSLIDEWEGMRGAPAVPSEAAEPAPPGEADVTRSPKEFLVLVRNVAFAVVRAIARRDFAGAIAQLAPGEFDAARLEQAFAPFWDEHRAIRLDPKARSAESYRIASNTDEHWTVEQTIFDDVDANDWGLEFSVDLPLSRAEARAVLRLVQVLR